jgi:hypothetical protein
MHPITPCGALCIGNGNRKVGRALTFSLPSRLTCPGASTWCLRRCYAFRYERLRPLCLDAYGRNLFLSLDANRFAESMLAMLPRGLRGVRIHVSGDFYSPTYADLWTRICQGRPDIVFWSYTRSWSVPTILPSLDALHRLANVRLFASCDETMPLPPAGWRTAFVEEDPRAHGVHCRKQQGQAESCLTCGYCLFSDTGHVVFKVH